MGPRARIASKTPVARAMLKLLNHQSLVDIGERGGRGSRDQERKEYERESRRVLRVIQSTCPAVAAGSPWRVGRHAEGDGDEREIGQEAAAEGASRDSGSLKSDRMGELRMRGQPCGTRK